MIRNRIAAGAVVLASALLVPATALAAGDTVKVTGPKTAKLNKKVTLKISGHTAKRTTLNIWVDSNRCAATNTAEASRSTNKPVLPAPRTVHGKFRDTVTFEHSSAGTHYICAYLYNAGGKVGPDKRATHKYVTH